MTQRARDNGEVRRTVADRPAAVIDISGRISRRRSDLLNHHWSSEVREASEQ
jgi:hypothetical protein